MLISKQKIDALSQDVGLVSMALALPQRIGMVGKIVRPESHFIQSLLGVTEHAFYQGVMKKVLMPVGVGLSAWNAYSAYDRMDWDVSHSLSQNIQNNFSDAMLLASSAAGLAAMGCVVAGGAAIPIAGTLGVISLACDIAGAVAIPLTTEGDGRWADAGLQLGLTLLFGFDEAHYRAVAGNVRSGGVSGNGLINSQCPQEYARPHNVAITHRPKVFESDAAYAVIDTGSYQGRSFETFAMKRTPVTNAEFGEFVRALGEKRFVVMSFDAATGRFTWKNAVSSLEEIPQYKQAKAEHQAEMEEAAKKEYKDQDKLGESGAKEFPMKEDDWPSSRGKVYRLDKSNYLVDDDIVVHIDSSAEDDLPVVGLSFFQAQAYCLWKSQTTSLDYALPTRDQFHYVASCGEQGQYNISGGSRTISRWPVSVNDERLAPSDFGVQAMGNVRRWLSYEPSPNRTGLIIGTVIGGTQDVPKKFQKFTTVRLQVLGDSQTGFSPVINFESPKLVNFRTHVRAGSNLGGGGVGLISTAIPVSRVIDPFNSIGFYLPDSHTFQVEGGSLIALAQHRGYGVSVSRDFASPNESLGAFVAKNPQVEQLVLGFHGYPEEMNIHGRFVSGQELDWLVRANPDIVVNPDLKFYAHQGIDIQEIKYQEKNPGPHTFGGIGEGGLKISNQSMVNMLSGTTKSHDVKSVIVVSCYGAETALDLLGGVKNGNDRLQFAIGWTGLVHKKLAYFFVAKFHEKYKLSGSVEQSFQDAVYECATFGYGYNSQLQYREVDAFKDKIRLYIRK